MRQVTVGLLVVLTGLVLMEERAHACEVVSVKRFEPAAGAPAAATEVPPAPMLDQVGWRRGAYFSGAPCEDDGALTLILGPASQRPLVEQGALGLRVKLVHGAVPFVVPDFPIQVLRAQRLGRVVLSWREPHGPVQPAIDAELELAYVDRYGRTGPPFRVRLHETGRGWRRPILVGAAIGLGVASLALWLMRRKR